MQVKSQLLMYGLYLKGLLENFRIKFKFVIQIMKKCNMKKFILDIKKLLLVLKWVIQEIHVKLFLDIK